MSDKIFIDTNILIYFYTKTEPEKLEKLEKLLNRSDLVVSTQILNELSNVLLKKFSKSADEVCNVLKEVEELCFVYEVKVKNIIHALSVVKKYKFSFFDSLMLASASESDCKIIYSEDMHNGLVIDNVLTIINPFKVI